MKKLIHKLLPETVDTQMGYTGIKLGTCFEIEDRNKFDQQHDLLYDAKCPSELCDKNCIGESGRRIAEKVKYYNGRDHKWYTLILSRMGFLGLLANGAKDPPP